METQSSSEAVQEVNILTSSFAPATLATLVDRKIVHDDDVAALECWRQTSFHVKKERRPIDGAFQDERCLHSAHAQAGHPRCPAFDRFDCPNTQIRPRHWLPRNRINAGRLAHQSAVGNPRFKPTRNRSRCTRAQAVQHGLIAFTFAIGRIVGNRSECVGQCFGAAEEERGHGRDIDQASLRPQLRECIYPSERRRDETHVMAVRRYCFCVRVLQGSERCGQRLPRATQAGSPVPYIPRAATICLGF